MQYLECTLPMTDVDEKLNYVCLRWATEDEIDYTFKYIEENRNETIMETGEWLNIVPFDKIASLIRVICLNFGIEPLTEQPPWVCHGFYINCFYRKSTGFSNENATYNI